MVKNHNFSRTAALLLAFGGPQALHEVGSFLEEVLGRKPSPHQIKTLKARYQLIGGSSPLPQITLRQGRALQNKLQQGGLPLVVHVAMRFGRPSIAEAVQTIAEQKVYRIILVSLSPYRSPFTSEGYYREVRDVVAKHHEGVDLLQVADWYDHPCLAAAWAQQMERTSGNLRKEQAVLPVIFTAHSLPQKATTDYPYVTQIEQTIARIVDIAGTLPWRLAFQSRGRGKGPWLGPDPEVVLEELRQVGYRSVLVVPVGFVTDHLETLYDLDVSLKQWAQARRMDIVRVPCLNDAPELIETLAQVVTETLEQA